MASVNCRLWTDLLNGEFNRGQIYNDFLTERQALVEHLKICISCGFMIAAVSPSRRVPNFESMTADQFAKIIRQLYKLAQTKRGI